MSVIVDTTKYILDYLKTVAPNAVCRRAYYPYADISELKAAGKPVILVVPIERQGELFREGGVVKNDLFIDVIVNAKLQQAADEPEKQVEEIDAFMELVETIFSSCHKRTIKDDTTHTEIHLMNPVHVVLNDDGEIEERNCFLSAIRLQVKLFIDSI